MAKVKGARARGGVGGIKKAASDWQRSFCLHMVNLAFERRKDHLTIDQMCASRAEFFKSLLRSFPI